MSGGPWSFQEHFAWISGRKPLLSSPLTETETVRSPPLAACKPMKSQCSTQAGLPWGMETDAGMLGLGGALHLVGGLELFALVWEGWVEAAVVLAEPVDETQL